MIQHQDVLILGAGLSGSLIAWTLKAFHPSLKVTLFESRNGNPLSKTWSFHASDINLLESILQPLVSRQWSGYTVYFRHFERTFHSDYLSVKPQHLEMKVSEILANDFVKGVRFREITSSSVTLENGARYEAPCVIDARSFPSFKTNGEGYQKFVGLHCQFRKPHGLRFPVLMDAQVAQLDGYRFMYLLPWSEMEVLIEDTRYSDSNEINLDEFLSEIKSYCEMRNWEIEKMDGLEQGALAIPFGFKKNPETTEIPAVGAGAGYFHPVTGYSFAHAAQIAQRIAMLSPITTGSVRRLLSRYTHEIKNDQRYFFLLNRMLFGAANPEERVKVFERFYQLPENLIQNFYRGRLTFGEKLRILSGKPPVPVFKAIRSSWAGRP